MAGAGQRQKQWGRVTLAVDLKPRAGSSCATAKLGGSTEDGLDPALRLLVLHPPRAALLRLARLGGRSRPVHLRQQAQRHPARFCHRQRTDHLDAPGAVRVVADGAEILGVSAIDERDARPIYVHQHPRLARALLCRSASHRSEDGGHTNVAALEKVVRPLPLGVVAEDLRNLSRWIERGLCRHRHEPRHAAPIAELCLPERRIRPRTRPEAYLHGAPAHPI